jgi:hypothetical protein
MLDNERIGWIVAGDDASAVTNLVVARDRIPESTHLQKGGLSHE